MSAAAAIFPSKKQDQPISATSIRPGEELFAPESGVGFHSFYDVFEKRHVTVNTQCLPAHPNMKSGCMHRVIVHSLDGGAGFYDTALDELCEMYAQYDGERFLQPLRYAIESSDIQRDEPVPLRVLEAISEYVWSPPSHFRRAAMKSSLPLVVSRARYNYFGELQTCRFRIDETSEETLIELCKSEYAGVDVVRSFLKRFPAAPVTEASLHALCLRQYTGPVSDTKACMESEEIACHILTYGQCQIDTRLISSAARSSLNLKSVFMRALDDITYAWRVVRDSRNARLFCKTFSKIKRRALTGEEEEARFDLERSRPSDMGSEEDVQICVFIKHVLGQLFGICRQRSSK